MCPIERTRSFAATRPLACVGHPERACSLAQPTHEPAMPCPDTAAFLAMAWAFIFTDYEPALLYPIRPKG